MIASRRWLSARAKRLIDICGATAGLLLLSPVIAAVSLIIRRTLGRPVFFWQARSGLRGTPINVPKFRTMTDERGPDGALLH